MFASKASQNDALAMQDFPASAVLGEGLPAEVENHLRAAAAVYDDDEMAMRHLVEAQRIAPTHPATLIGLYRFHFYKGRLEETLAVARACLTRAAIDNSLPFDWRAVRPHDAKFGDYDSPQPRFFMFTLKGYAYLNMRLGDYEEGREAIEKLLELDPADKVGARVLLDVLDRMGEEDVD